MVSEDTKTTAIGIGGLLSLAVAAYLGLSHYIKKPPEGKVYTLILEATTGGTTEPAPGIYVGDEPVMVTVTAIPSAGYEFDGWYFAGDKVSTDLSYTVEVNKNILLIASFVKTGAPPLIPAYIKPVQNCIAENWWKVVQTTELLTHTLHIDVDYFVSGYAKFKICDAAGNGVPNQKIAVYTDAMPDALDYGYLFLGRRGNIATRSNPLILTSNSVGEVAVECFYEWIEPNSNYKYTLGYCGRVRWACIAGLNNWTGPPIWDRDYLTKPCYFNRFERLRHPVYRNLNPIHAFWVDNPSLIVYGDAYADCMIKFMESKNAPLDD